ncbi:unnamed protein product [Cochlearia groenlandica]
MYIEEINAKEEKEERFDKVFDEDKSVSMSRRGNKEIVLKKVLVGVGARALFYPTLVYNVVRNKLEPEFRWWDKVAEFILLGAVPFPSHVPRLKELGVCGVITLNEPYETLVASSLYKSYCIDHLVIATRDYCFAPSMDAICRAVDFIHRNASLGKMTYVHCKAGRGRSTTVVICYLVQHKHMTPEEAYAYVRSIRPRVLLAATQWKAVLEYYHVMVLSTPQSSITEANSTLVPSNVNKQVCSSNVVVFDDGSMVVVTSSDLEGYTDDESMMSMNVHGNELWAAAAAADLSMVYRVKVVGQAALTRLSCLWLGLRDEDHHKLSGKNLSMGGGISVDISVY